MYKRVIRHPLFLFMQIFKQANNNTMILCSIIVLGGIIEIAFGRLFNYKISDRILYS